MNTQTRFPRGRASVQAGVIETLPAQPKRLSKSEISDRERLEEKITEGFQSAGKIFAKIGEYLEEIRSRELYREYGTWGDYLRAKWNRSTAWALMQRRAAAVMLNLADAAPADRNSCFDSTTGTGLPASPATSIPNPALAIAGQADDHPGEFWRDFEERKPSAKMADGQSPIAKPMLPTSEGQIRALAVLPAKEQKPAWKAAERAAGPGKQPTGKQVRAAVEEIGKAWPKPNEHGAFEEKTGKAECVRFTAPGASAQLYLLQVKPNEWLFAKSVMLGKGSCSSPLSRNGKSHSGCTSREAALQFGMIEIRGYAESDQPDTASRKTRIARQKLIDWTYRFLPTEAKPESIPDSSGQWVVCRRALPGATSPTAMVARFSGPGWGWSPNPEKGKAFTDKQEALSQAWRHNDDVVSLDEARRSSAPATIQVRAHERIVGEPQKGQEIVEAKFRVIDAEVELRSALLILKRAGGELTQELYHAEKAQDHLGCLKTLLTNGGVKKGNPRPA